MKFPDKETLTIREKYDPAMKITDPEDAHYYFEKCVEHNMRTSDHTREEAEEIERHNLGYYSGYYNRETQERVEKLFGAIHPVFGSVDEPDLTIQETMELGKRWAGGQGPNSARLDILSERAQKELPYRVDVYCSGGWQHCASFASQTDAFVFGEAHVVGGGARVWQEGTCIAVSYGPNSWHEPVHNRDCDGAPCECGAVPALGSMALPEQVSDSDDD